MYQVPKGLSTMDFWTGSDSAGYSASSSDDLGSSDFRAAPDLARRSCSPESLTHLDKNPLGFDNPSIGPQQQNFQPTQTPAPFKQSQVSYLAGSFHNPMRWPPAQRLGSGYMQPSSPRKFVFEAPQCCVSPRIRLVHDCCNKETPARELVDERVYARRAQLPPKLTLCRFCLKNGESPELYFTHSLHSDDGRVSCPVLRRYDCPVCRNGGGDYAHTLRYCPVIRANILRR